MSNCFKTQHPNATAVPTLVDIDTSGVFGYLKNSSACGAQDGTGLDAATINRVLFAMQSLIEQAGVDAGCDIEHVLAEAISEMSSVCRRDTYDDTTDVALNDADDFIELCIPDGGSGVKNVKLTVADFMAEFGGGGGGALDVCGITTVYDPDPAADGPVQGGDTVALCDEDDGTTKKTTVADLLESAGGGSVTTEITTPTQVISWEIDTYLHVEAHRWAVERNDGGSALSPTLRLSSDGVTPDGPVVEQTLQSADLPGTIPANNQTHGSYRFTVTRSVDPNGQGNARMTTVSVKGAWAASASATPNLVYTYRAFASTAANAWPYLMLEFHGANKMVSGKFTRIH